MNVLARIALSALLLTFASCKQGSDSEKTNSTTKEPGSTEIPGKAGTNHFTIPPPPDVGVVPKDAQTTKRGLSYKVLKPGTGTEHPGLNDTVLVHLTGWTPDGKLHNTTRRGKPHPMVISQSPRGWQEGLRMMTKGEQRRFWMPPKLAFPATSKNAPQVLMTYDVELVDIEKAPAIPEDVAAAPADAKKTRAGVAYRVLTPGTGTDHPSRWDEVKINFTEWNKYGQMLATTMMKKRPSVFPVYRKGPVWAEILATMVVGQKSRFWVPAEVAQRKQGKDAQAQVYDIELLELTKQHPAPATPDPIAEPPPGAKKTVRGASYERVKRGRGKKKPDMHSLVTVNFTTWNTKGELLDSTVVRDEPVEYGMNQLPVPAWHEVLADMVVGEVDNVWVPAKSMPRPRGRRRLKETFVFQLELVAVRQRPEPPPAPKDVAAPPENAQKTEKGVYYVLLEKGTGTEHPTARSKVEVNYTGWTTDGKRFDSSVPQGKPKELSMSRVIAGWRDGLKTMVVGEKKRFWIPQELAYRGKPGRPAGMLVFDVELLEIK